MKFTPEVIAALQILREHAENDFERHRINVLERDLTAPPQVEIVDDTHQRFDGVTYHKDKGGHYRTTVPIHRAHWSYYHGEVPKGYDIHHINGDKTNNDISNLLILKKSEHHSLHRHIAIAKEYTCVCDVCGKIFSSLSPKANTRFCSAACNAQAQRKRKKNYTIRKCVVCGKNFSVFKTKTTRCCSKSCAMTLSWQTGREKITEKICPTCNKKFSPKRRKQIYCSRTCAAKSRETLTEKICPVCGRKFMPANSKVTYCSKTCSNKAMWARKK